MRGKRVTLLAGALVLGAGWVSLHTSVWEPQYRQAPPERTTTHAPSGDDVRQRSPYLPVGPWSRPAEPPPPGACTPPPGQRDGTYTCAYIVVRTQEP